MTPEDGLKELAVLHLSVVQVQIPVAFPHFSSISFGPHPLAVAHSSPFGSMDLDKNLYGTIHR